MEVHHHSHTSRKKWTHYFWEFLMLFLAVFCGFLAEYQLEHVIEKKREKQFIRSLISDLQLDTALLNTVTNSAKSRIQSIDSFLLFLAHSETNEMSVAVYLQLRRGNIQTFFFPNDGTLVQLKNSGGMRLITSRNAVDSIEEYASSLRRLELRRVVTIETNHDFSQVLNKAVHGKDVMKAIYDSLIFDKQVTKQTIQLNSDHVNELINQAIQLRFRVEFDTVRYSEAKRSADMLIDFLRKEYHLK